jgi:4-methyl-5(b-hydroxyethyl)-thiazole monophosphate biosynthesis
MNSQRALVFVFNGVEEIEALTPVDLLRRAGVTVDLVSTETSRSIIGRNRIRIEADATFETLPSDEYALLVVPGGPGHSALLEHSAVLEFIARHASEGRWTASICAGPLILQKAGVLANKRFTAFPATAHLFEMPPFQEAVVRDGHLITSRGAGTAFPFALALVEALSGSETAQSIAEETCYTAF